MYTSSTTYWLNSRAVRGGLAQPQRSRLASHNRSLEAVTALACAAKSVPFWVVFATIALATAAVCATVISRARAQVKIASTQHQELYAEIQGLKHDNQQLQMEIRRITGDASSIEFAARERLGMVKPSDIVVPIESKKASPTLGSVSFVH